MLLLLLGIIVISIYQLNVPSESFVRLFHRFSIVVSFSCCCLAIYGIFQGISIFPSNPYLGITGGFDNPAGYAASLCAGFPMILYLPKLSQSKWVMGSTFFAVLLIVFAVILSGSRAGMLSIIVMLILWLLLKVKVTGKMVVLSSVSILLLFSILYFYKKDSADGRLLIWQCSWEMIKEKPLLGHGIGGFQANYMNYQANYFKQNPDSSFVRLADSTNRAFNEYVLLIVNYGFVGLIFFSHLSVFFGCHIAVIVVFNRSLHYFL